MKYTILILVLLFFPGCQPQQSSLAPEVTPVSPAAEQAVPVPITASRQPPPTATPEQMPQAGRTAHGRIILGHDDAWPIPGMLLRLEPDGEFVAETNADGRFTLDNLSREEITVYMDDFQFTIPAGDKRVLALGDIEYDSLRPAPLQLADYPPSSSPYRIEQGDYWLVHTPEGQLFAFFPFSPEYVAHIDKSACRYTWSETVGRFIDPCSGDEWELNGTLNREHSTEMWSDRDLDQYPISVQEDTIFVQHQYLAPGMPVNEPPLALAAQYGITVSVAAAEFTASVTAVDTWVQVDPIWRMSPSVFPPQQALTYPTFPDSLFDDQGRSIPGLGREGNLAVPGARAGGIRQLMYNRWQAVAPDAEIVTATLTIDLSNLHRQISVPVDWDSGQEGAVWTVDIPLEIGYAAVRVRQIEWLQTQADGRANLRLTVVDDSPEDINLFCLHLDIDDPWQRSCANFNGEKSYPVIAQPGEPVALHLRASLALHTPFQLVLAPGAR